MSHAGTADETPIRGVGQLFLMRLFVGFALLAVVSLALSVAGKWLGRSMVNAGHSTDATLREIVIGNNVLSVPANAIRFESERRDGVAGSLHLYLRWPLLQGYTLDTRDDFNHAGGARNIIFASFQPQMMSRGMSDRLEPIYSALIVSPGRAGPADLTIHDFSEKSGYVNEVLVVGPEEAGGRFVARCLTGAMARDSLAGCERDMVVGDGLSLTYRFPERLLESWRALDAAIAGYVSAALRAQD